MDSFLYSYAIELGEKWKEVELLLEKALENQESDSEFHQVLCRSTTVLMISQLEGFTKNMLRALINDFNRCDFTDLPIAIQRTYCKNYMPRIDGVNENKFNGQIEKLLIKFREINCNISHEPFFVSKNKNPNPHLMSTVFKNLGVKDIFHCLNESKYDDVFSSSRSELIDILDDLKAVVLQEVKVYPYNSIEDNCSIDVLKTNGKTLWEEFLDRVNQRRHAVAHGNETNNTSSIDELINDKLKIQIFEFASLRLLAKYLVNVQSVVAE